MRIAFVSQPGDMVLPPVQTSLGIWTYEVAGRLAQSHEVIVYARGGRLGKIKTENDRGVQYRRVSTGLDARLHKVLAKLPGRRNAKRPLFSSSLHYLGYAAQVAYDLRAQQCDIVHLFNYSQFVPVLRALNPSISIALHMECEWLTQLDSTIVEPRLEKTDLIIGCSEYITAKVRDHFPRFADRCQTIYNGVDVHRFVDESSTAQYKREPGMLERNGTQRVLFVGRISPEKGLHALLDAFQQVVKRYPEAQLIIAGDTGQCPRERIVDLSDEEAIRELACFYDQDHRESYLHHLQRQLDSSSIVGHVIFAGFIPNTQLVDQYRAADVLVNPSLSEAFGISLVEAMATGIPVVATRVGGMVEIVQESRTGYLVEPGNAEALAEAILRLLSDKDLRRSMGEAGRQRALELFAWERVVESLLHHFGDLCERRDCTTASLSAAPS